MYKKNNNNKMKITLSLQPGNKVQIPLEIPDEELKALTVLNLKEKIMELNKQKKLEELHVVYGSTILDDDKIFMEYNVTEGSIVKFLFAPVMKGESNKK